jgi:hypothetical protein
MDQLAVLVFQSGDFMMRAPCTFMQAGFRIRIDLMLDTDYRIQLFF